MKKRYSALLAIALPFAAIAQPTINHAENYAIGEEIIYHLTTATPPGPAGHQTWDFSALPDTTGATISYVTTDSAGGYIVDGITDINNTATRTYMVSNGVYSYAANGPVYAMRPMNYNDADNNSFTDSTLIGHGYGTSDLSVDGWGTLKTPVANYVENVLRVRVAVHQVDTGIINITSDHIYYLWYVDNHNAPVFRVDSIKSILSNQSTTQFLTADFPADVKTLSASANLAKVHLDNSTLTLDASLQQGQAYQVDVFSISGQKVYNTIFTASGTVEHLNLNNQVAAGTYIVSILQKNSNTPIIVKTVKE